MNKRIISLILSLGILFSCVIAHVNGAEEQPIKRYYNLTLQHTSYAGYTDLVPADFMIRQTSSNEKEQLYIKAEDFADITATTGDCYSYNQCLTECAYVSNETGHVVRFLFDSVNVSVLYVGQPVKYSAPYPALYEDNVAWIPFEFAIELFYMQAIPQDGTIAISSIKYNPISAANIVHKNFRNFGFDWMGEVGESASEYFVNKNSAAIATCCNRLLSFELSEWSAALLCVAGYDYAYDAYFVEKIAKAFITPSAQEAEELDISYFKVSANTFDTVEDFTALVDGDINPSSFWDRVLLAYPSLGKVRISRPLTDICNQPVIEPNFNTFLKQLQDGWKNKTISAGDFAKCLVWLIEYSQYVSLYENKSDRATAALEQYAAYSDYDESQIFKEYSYHSNSEHLDALGRLLLDNIDSIALNNLPKLFGKVGFTASLLGFAWSAVSLLPPAKSALDSVENRTLSEYAVKYQDECRGLYYDKRNACLAEGGGDPKTLEAMINAQYTYLKFSYIARNAATESYKNVSSFLFDEGKINNMNTRISTLEQKNQTVAQFLNLMEQNVFTPTDAANYVWDDTVYLSELKANGTPVEQPTQHTKPVFELPPFPEAEGVDYIDEAEALKIAQKVTDKLTGGLTSGVLGGFMEEALGTTEIYTYEVVDTYVGNNEKAYVVAMRIQGNLSALYFVSIVGNEVWLGVKDSSAPGGYYVYTDLDILHADTSDFIAALRDLSEEFR